MATPELAPRSPAGRSPGEASRPEARGLVPEHGLPSYSGSSRAEMASLSAWAARIRSAATWSK